VFLASENEFSRFTSMFFSVFSRILSMDLANKGLFNMRREFITDFNVVKLLTKFFIFYCFFTFGNT